LFWIYIYRALYVFCKKHQTVTRLLVDRLRHKTGTCFHGGHYPRLGRSR
jgi:hypothetical protein